MGLLIIQDGQFPSDLRTRFVFLLTHRVIQTSQSLHTEPARNLHIQHTHTRIVQNICEP